MGFSSVLQGKCLINGEFELPCTNPAQDIPCPLQELFACQGVMRQARAGDEQRPFGA